MQANARPSIPPGHCERIRTLSTHGWLSQTDGTFSEAVIAAGVWKKVERDTRLFKSGDCANDVIGLAEGVLAITSGGDFEEDAIIHISRPPTWLGWPALFGDTRHSYTATMKSAGWVLKVSRRALVALLDRNPPHWTTIMPLVARYDELATIATDDLLIRKSEQRVIAVLLRFSGHEDPDGGPALNRLPITQHELAGATNLSRNALIPILHGLEARNVIELGKGYLLVRDTDALARLRIKAPCATDRSPRPSRGGGRSDRRALEPAQAFPMA